MVSSVMGVRSPEEDSLSRLADIAGFCEELNDELLAAEELRTQLQVRCALERHYQRGQGALGLGSEM